MHPFSGHYFNLVLWLRSILATWQGTNGDHWFSLMLADLDGANARVSSHAHVTRLRNYSQNVTDKDGFNNLCIHVGRRWTKVKSYFGGCQQQQAKK